jgi:NADH-ubiquinone oxidoreductase chain 6
MYNLHLFFEMLANGFADNILIILAIIAIYFGISVINHNNPVISILYLIGLIASIGCYLISEGYSFLGLSYLIIYIGAVYHVLKDSFLASALLVLYIFFNN